MLRRKFVLVAVLAAFGAAPAHAGGTFDVFKSFCLDSKADFDAVTASAAKAGWSAVQPQTKAADFAMAQMADPRKQLFLTAQSSPQQRSCSLGAAAAVAGDLATGAVRFAGVPATDLGGMGTMYSFTGDGAQHTPIAVDSPESEAAHMAGKARAVLVNKGADVTLVSYTVFLAPN